jgi:hypothetical protein
LSGLEKMISKKERAELDRNMRLAFPGLTLSLFEKFLASIGLKLIKSSESSSRQEIVSLETLKIIRRDCYGLTDEEAEIYNAERIERQKSQGN